MLQGCYEAEWVQFWEHWWDAEAGGAINQVTDTCTQGTRSMHTHHQVVPAVRTVVQDPQAPGSDSG